MARAERGGPACSAADRCPARWLRRTRPIALLAFGVVGCSNSTLETGHCTSDGESSITRQINPGPNCNGRAHANECALGGAPSAYGVEEGCEVPATFEPGQCQPRPRRLEGCVAVGRLLCCPP